MELMTSATCESIANEILQAQNVGGAEEDNANKDGEQDAAMTNGESDASTSAEEEDDYICFQPLVDEQSLFEPDLQEYFTQSPPRLIKHLTNHNVKPLLKLDNSKVSTNPNSIPDPLHNPGAIEGKLPQPCQDTLDELTVFVESFDVSEIGKAMPVEEIQNNCCDGSHRFCQASLCCRPVEMHFCKHGDNLLPGMHQQ
jgi:hypothetical protein